MSTTALTKAARDAVATARFHHDNGLTVRADPFLDLVDQLADALDQATALDRAAVLTPDEADRLIGDFSDAVQFVVEAGPPWGPKTAGLQQELDRSHAALRSALVGAARDDGDGR